MVSARAPCRTSARRSPRCGRAAPGDEANINAHPLPADQPLSLRPGTNPGKPVDRRAGVLTNVDQRLISDYEWHRERSPVLTATERETPCPDPAWSTGCSPARAR